MNAQFPDYLLMRVKIRSRYKGKKITTSGKEMKLFDNNILLKDIIFMYSRIFDLIVYHVCTMSYAKPEEKNNLFWCWAQRLLNTYCETHYVRASLFL